MGDRTLKKCKEVIAIKVRRVVPSGRRKGAMTGWGSWGRWQSSISRPNLEELPQS